MTDVTAEQTSSPPNRPGWPEILVGAASYLVSFGAVFLLLPLITDDVVTGIVGLFVSGIMGLIAFAVAYLIRIRRLEAFGIRRARFRHLAAGAGLGVAAYLLGLVAATVYITLTGDAQNIQTSYQAAAAGGALAFALTLIAGSLITPIGEEFFFRGVVANALLTRWPTWVAVIVSAAIFALAHGINPILPIAFVVGILAALLFRWSGSVWPGVVLHGVNNALASTVPLILGTVLT